MIRNLKLSAAIQSDKDIDFPEEIYINDTLASLIAIRCVLLTHRTKKNSRKQTQTR